MKAAIINNFGAPGIFEIREMPIPEPENHQVLVKIYAASVNPVDYKIRKGNHKYLLGSGFPIILGFDFAGIVEKTGNKISRFKKGDKVYGRADVKFGKTYAQFGVTSENTLSLIPENLSFEQAAAIPLASLTALQALRDKGKIKAGDKLLITGATGGVGHFAVQLGKYFNAHCTAVSSYRHINYIKELGPDDFFDYTKEDFKQRNEKYDIIFDAAGKESYLTCKHILNEQGIFITTLPRPKLLFHKLISIFSNGKVRTLLMKSNHKDLDFISGLIKKGYIKVKIDKTFTLEKIADAHEYAELGHSEGKIVISIEQ